MPTYEYYCEDCGNTYEIFQSIDENIDRPPTHCPECDPDLERDGTLSKYFGNCRPAFKLHGGGVHSPGWKC